ncbi:MAG: class I SAM-dependent methyltransferase [Pseudomonadota bacterium]
MDAQTIAAYNRNAAGFARDWEEDQQPPADLRAAVARYFAPGPTIDVGCGSGRDTAWLHDAGFDVVGVDAAATLLAEASRRHPGVRFELDALPALATLPRGHYANVLCETVLMHLDVSNLVSSVATLTALLAPRGTLYLTWRVTEDTHRRDEHDRLYAAFDASLVRQALGDVALLLDEDCLSASSGKRIHRLIARR